MEILVDTFHILNGNLFSEHHFVKCANEERVQETAMEDCKSDNSSNEFEVIQMFRVDSRMRVYL